MSQGGFFERQELREAKTGAPNRGVREASKGQGRGQIPENASLLF